MMHYTQIDGNTFQGCKNNLFSIACQVSLLFFCIFAASYEILGVLGGLERALMCE